MKLYGLLGVILLGSSISAKDAVKLCDEKHCSDLNDKSCKCWCSVKCGPRAKGVGGNGEVDTPRWNKEHKKCFCQDRDEDLYVENCVKQ